MVFVKLNRLCRSLQTPNVLPPLCILPSSYARPLTTHKATLLQQIKLADKDIEEEWANAKEYKEIPGPSSIGLMMDFLPGGKLYGANFLQMYTALRKRYGDLFILRGSFGRDDLICSFNPIDFEKVYRTEGVWPIREGLGSIKYYRQVKNPNAYPGVFGLVAEQGERWFRIRQKINPIMMKMQSMREELPEIDCIAKELVDKIDVMRDPKTGMLTTDLVKELRMWSFESVCYVALNSRLHLVSGKADADALRMSDTMAEFLQSTYEHDIAPSIWIYYQTPSFKRLMRMHDDLTEITRKFVDTALERIEAEGNKEASGVFEKLLRVDKNIAVVMAIDMMFGGLDTTSSTVIIALYLLAKNPEKQDILREELRTLLPTSDTPLNAQNLKNIPYLRACIKESMRITPIVSGTMRQTGRDLVLSGYKVPKGTGVNMRNMEVCNSEKFFPRCSEYIPERWLKMPKNVARPVDDAKSQNPFVYLPFGFGPRTCIGRRLAELELEVLLARMLRKYKISWTDEQNGLQYVSNIVLAPCGEMKFKFDEVE
ncbi:probable cytochrome P450 12b2, mitochondrial [Anastrepha ludens]|uniref:probable cytochrome P450 12b2, mitochondrial n=1 Tax=Anastrepha ludens TaxID=28586 RepID=UPI0023AEFB06|nr:probable cytochrome P450 12b2, mitochondrial [Anastrepha ludens]